MQNKSKYYLQMKNSYFFSSNFSYRFYQNEGVPQKQKYQYSLTQIVHNSRFSRWCSNYSRELMLNKCVCIFSLHSYHSQDLLSCQSCILYISAFPPQANGWKWKMHNILLF